MTPLAKIKFGRLPQLADYRDRPLSAYITEGIRRKAELMGSKSWTVARVLDQGASNHCVGYAWTHFGIALPVHQDWYGDMGRSIYYAAKVIDGEPGNEGGTYTRSGVQAFMQFSKLKDNAYAWASSVSEVATWVLAVGPVITGTRWYSGMMTPNSDGRVQISGSVVGGHEWVINGANADLQLFYCVNSWGTDWGQGGHFMVSFSDYARLLAEYGDACTAAEIGVDPVVSKPLRLTLGDEVLYNEAL